MSYFNYHAMVKKMIDDGKLITYYFVDAYKDVSPALILIFNDPKRPVIPIRQHAWDKYLDLIEKK